MTKSSRHALALLIPMAFVGCGGECYVGVSGTEASITVKDLFPDDTCQGLVSNPGQFLGDIAEVKPNGLYSMTERPAQPVMCEYEIDGKHFTVRDDGMLKVVGNILCSALAKRAN